MSEKPKHDQTVSKKYKLKLEEDRKWREEFMKHYKELSSDESVNAIPTSLCHKNFVNIIPNHNCRESLTPTIQHNFDAAKTNIFTKKYITTLPVRSTQIKKIVLENSTKETISKDIEKNALVENFVIKSTNSDVAEKDAIQNSSKKSLEEKFTKNVVVENLTEGNSDESLATTDRCPLCIQRASDSKCLKKLANEMVYVRHELNELVKEVKSQHKIKDILDKLIVLDSSYSNKQQESSVCDKTSNTSIPPNNICVPKKNSVTFKTSSSSSIHTHDQFQEQKCAKTEILELPKSSSNRMVKQELQNESNINKQKPNKNLSVSHLANNMPLAKTGKCKKFKQKFLLKHLSQKNTNALSIRTGGTRKFSKNLLIKYHNPKYVNESLTNGALNGNRNRQNCCEDSTVCTVNKVSKGNLEFVDDYQDISSCSSESSQTINTLLPGKAGHSLNSTHSQIYSTTLLDNSKSSVISKQRRKKKRSNKLSNYASEKTITNPQGYYPVNTSLNTEGSNLVKKISSTRNDFISDNEFDSLSSEELLKQCNSNDFTDNNVTSSYLSSDSSYKSLTEQSVKDISSKVLLSDNINHHNSELNENMLIKSNTYICKKPCELTTKISPDHVDKNLSKLSVEDDCNTGILDKIRKFNQNLGNATNFVNKSTSSSDKNQKSITKQAVEIETGRVSVLKYIKQFENQELRNDSLTKNNFATNKKVNITKEAIKTPPKPPKKPTKQNYPF